MSIRLSFSCSGMPFQREPNANKQSESDRSAHAAHAPPRPGVALHEALKRLLDAGEAVAVPTAAGTCATRLQRACRMGGRARACLSTRG